MIFLQYTRVTCHQRKIVVEDLRRSSSFCLSAYCLNDHSVVWFSGSSLKSASIIAASGTLFCYSHFNSHMSHVSVASKQFKLVALMGAQASLVLHCSYFQHFSTLPSRAVFCVTTAVASWFYNSSPFLYFRGRFGRHTKVQHTNQNNIAPYDQWNDVGATLIPDQLYFFSAWYAFNWHDSFPKWAVSLAPVPRAIRKSAFILVSTKGVKISAILSLIFLSIREMVVLDARCTRVAVWQK